MRFVIAATLAAGVGAPALADTFSFASGTLPDSPVLRGGVGVAQIVQVPNATIGFIYDFDGNGPGPGVNNPGTGLSLGGGVATSYAVIPLGGLFLHTYSLGPGSVQFSGLLDISYRAAVVTSWSPFSDRLGETLTIQSNEMADPTISFVGSGPLAGRNLTQRESFSFALSNLRSASGPGALVTPNGGFAEDWIADASFTAFAIPSPGFLALGGLGMAMMGRRNRR